MTTQPLSSAVLISMLQRLTRERLAKCVAENDCPECAIALAEQVKVLRGKR